MYTKRFVKASTIAEKVYMCMYKYSFIWKGTDFLRWDFVKCDFTMINYYYLIYYIGIFELIMPPATVLLYYASCAVAYFEWVGIARAIDTPLWAQHYNCHVVSLEVIKI